MSETFNLHSVKERYYQQFRESQVESLHISHEVLERILGGLSPELFSVSTIGQSVAGTSLYGVSVGHGSCQVLLCSLMHGDEPTATKALLDLFNFLAKPGIFWELRDTVLEELTIHVIPMSNPDGARSCQRRNAQGIDQ